MKCSNLAATALLSLTLGAAPQAFEAADAYGVMGMRERARHFGGDIRISSTPGQGTRMALSVALPERIA